MSGVLGRWAYCNAARPLQHWTYEKALIPHECLQLTGDDTEKTITGLMVMRTDDTRRSDWTIVFRRLKPIIAVNSGTRAI